MELYREDAPKEKKLPLQGLKCSILYFEESWHRCKIFNQLSQDDSKQQIINKNKHKNRVLQNAIIKYSIIE